MTNSQKLNEILQKIDSSKEILSTMPKNNEKNIDIYVEKIKELEKEYEKYSKEIKEVLESRYIKETNIEENKEISDLYSRINTIEKVKYIFEDEKSSMAKIGLDKNIYKISKFYKDNLENVNMQIAEAINKFKEVGIKVDISDFNYTDYVQEYMTTFLEEMSKNTLDSDVLKSKFEEVYWKCPDIIVYIELNIRNIYLKYQNDIDKFLKKEKAEILKKWKKTPSEIQNSYLELKKRLIEQMDIDRKTLIDMFLNGKLNIKDFADNKLKENCLRLLPEEIVQNLEKNKDIVENIIKLLNSLYEYKNYLEFKFIVSDINNIYAEKDKYKKLNTEIRKKLQASEKKLQKINKKLNGKNFWSKKTSEIKQSPEMNNLVLEIKKTYKEFELNEFYNKIATQVNEHSTILDVLKLANSDYIYITDCIIRNDESISAEDIENKIIALNEFLENPYITAINNMSFKDEKDIALVIKDRYKLLKFKIEKEDLYEDNIDKLISIVKNIIIGANMKKAKIEVKYIEEICNLNKLLY